MSSSPLTLAGLAHMAGSQPGRAVVVEAVAMGECLGHHDIAVCDLTGWTTGAEDDVRRLVASGTPVVGVSPPGRSDLVARASAQGVSTVIGFEVSAERLLATLERAAAGRGRDADERKRGSARAFADRLGLTLRELEVLVLVAEGLTNAEIAGRLFLSVNTVKTYVRLAYRKIDVSSRSQAVLWAAQHGLRASSQPPGDEAPPRTRLDGDASDLAGRPR